MRMIGHLPDEKLARRFVDYLLVQKVKSQTEPDGGGRWAVWVHDDDHLDEATEELVNFRSTPDEKKYLTATATADQQRQREAATLAVFAARQITRDRMERQSLLGSLGITTGVIIGITVLVFIAQLLNEVMVWKWLGIVTIEPVDGNKLRWFPNGFLPEVRSGQFWRLVTPIFMHGDALHILMNMLLFANLGSAVERRYGGSRLTLFVILVAVVSNLLEYRFVSPGFAGMSGVVFGLFGFIWTQSKYCQVSGFVVPPMVSGIMIFWFIYCIVGLSGEIANFVHWGGLASGAVIGYVASVLQRHDLPPSSEPPA